MPVCFYGTSSLFGTVSTTTVAVDTFGRHGATQDLALRGSWSEWLGECHGKGRECEAMGSVVWVKCATSAGVFNLSIATSSVTDTTRE